MTLQSNGPISMQDVVTEFTLTTPTSVQDWYGLADGVPTSGPISFSDMLGKSAVIVKTVAATTENLNIQTLFTNEEWTASIPKRVVIPEGVIVGSLNPALPALRTGTGRVYRIEIEIFGEVQGASGVANSGAGGPAIQIEQSEVTVTIRPTGAVRGGGGGGSRGGTGGQGGQGFFYTYPREPASGDYYDRFGRYYVDGDRGWNWYWENDFGRYNSFSTSSASAVAVSNRTYYRGGTRTEWKRTGPDGDGYDYTNYGIYKITTVTNVTGGGAGGAGGTGGRGRGYTLSLTSGSAGAGGAAGGTNAGNGGTGGTGGTGGDWGVAGITGGTGGTGTTGNYTGGQAGAAAALGGQAGAAVYGVARTVTNLGTINGAVV